MYLEQGSTSLSVLALCALLGIVLGTFPRSREWLVGRWSRMTHVVARSRRRPDR